MPLYFLSMDTIDEYILTNHASPLLCIAIPVALCLFYPKLERWSTARGDTTVIVSVASGVCVGTHWAYRLGLMHKSSTAPPYALAHINTYWFLLVALRLVIGVAVLVVTRTVMKSLSLKIVGWVTKIDTKVKENQQQLYVELPYKFVTYFSIAIVTVMVVPNIFWLLNIHRDTYFSEL